MARSTVFHIGSARHRMDMMKFDITPDDRGGSTRVQTIVATVDAIIRPLTAQEYSVAQQQVMAVTVSIDIRYLPGVTHDMWFYYQEKYYAIRAIVNVNMRNRILNLWCEERAELR